MVFSLHAQELQNVETNNTKSSNEGKVRFYLTPEERREAGLGTRITEWLKFSGLMEFEKEYFENHLKNNKNKHRYSDATTLELGFEMTYTKWLGAEILYEAEYDNKTRTRFDEAFLSLEFDEIGVGAEVGMLYAPFGEYFSHFITGPLVEFGETRRNGLIVDYSLLENLDISGYLIESEIDKKNRSQNFDWGAAIEFTFAFEAVTIGAGYLSDLSESDEEFLRDENDEYKDRVSAWDAYATIGIGKFEVTAELLHANYSFKEFENDENKPSAYNFEIVYFIRPTLQLAARYEGSDEFADQPHEQYGVSVSWRVLDQFSVTADYLHGRFKNDFVFDEDGNELDDRDLLAVQITFEF